ncbi:MAG: glycosyltransferase family 1 protein [Elusimicrobiota bacterium]
MRIGIDAKWFFNGPPSGRHVVRSLVQNIIAVNSEHEIHVFLDKKDSNSQFPFGGTKVKRIYLWANINLISNLFIIPYLIKKYKIDCFIAQNFSPLLGSKCRISFIHDIIFESHPEFFTLRERIYFKPMKFLAKHSNFIFTVSESEKKRLIQYGYNAQDKIKVIHNGVDTHKFKVIGKQEKEQINKVKEIYHLPEKYILYVGRINFRKNLIKLVEAIDKITEKEIKLVLAGKKDWKNENIEEIIDNFSLKDRIVMIGYVEEEFLPIIYSLAKLLCYVSYEEGFGLPPLEAMASGLPVVVSDIEVVKEVCGDAGNYVNPFESKSIADMINKLLEDDNLYNRKKNLGLKRANLFSWESSTKKIMHFVEEHCSNNT